MKTRWVLLVCLAGCGSGSSAKEKQVCEHAASLCGADDAKSCTSEMADAKKVMGDHYEKFLSCAAEARSCGEYAGCAIGGLGGGAIEQLDDLGKGMKKVLRDEIGDGHGLDHIKDRVKSDIRRGLAELGGSDEALPAACKRIETVCSKDQPFIRKECTTLVENLGVDKPRIAELASCISASDNCFALEKCVDDMDSKMRGF